MTTEFAKNTVVGFWSVGEKNVALTLIFSSNVGESICTMKATCLLRPCLYYCLLIPMAMFMQILLILIRITTLPSANDCSCFQVARSPYVLDVLNIPGNQRSLERLADLLGKVQKALGEYLERERASFPRFVIALYQ